MYWLFLYILLTEHICLIRQPCFSGIIRSYFPGWVPVANEHVCSIRLWAMGPWDNGIGLLVLIEKTGQRRRGGRLQLRWSEAQESICIEENWEFKWLPSLRLTARTWKWMAGRLVSFFECPGSWWTLATESKPKLKRQNRVCVCVCVCGHSIYKLFEEVKRILGERTIKS